MNNSRISNNYITIVGAARVELGLKGNELLVFSIINGFSRTENMWFTGSTSYLCDWTGASKKTVIEILKKLVQKGYLIRGEKNGYPIYRTYKFYEASDGEAGANDPMNGGEITPFVGGEEITPGGVKTSLCGVKTTPNNNIYSYITSSYHSYKSDKEEDIYRELEYDLLYDEGLPFAQGN